MQIYTQCPSRKKVVNSKLSAVIRPCNDCGLMLAELALVLPFCLIFAAGIINFGSLMWSMELVSETIRWGTIRGAKLSTTGMKCTDVKLQVEAETKGQMMMIPYYSRVWWGNPVASFHQETWDKVTLNYFQVRISTRAQSNCVFCYERILSAQSVNVQKRVPLTTMCKYS